MNTRQNIYFENYKKIADDYVLQTSKFYRTLYPEVYLEHFYNYARVHRIIIETYEKRKEIFLSL